MIEPIILTLLAIFVIFLFRNELVFKHRMKCLNILYNLAIAQRIKEGGESAFETLLAEHYNRRSFYGMVFSVTKWRFKAFYPGVKNE